MDGKIKNDFCKNNNIPLYRIRYDENITERMSGILNSIGVELSKS